MLGPRQEKPAAWWTCTWGWWRRASLRTKIHLSYLLLISVPLAVVAAAAYQTSTTTIEQNAQSFSFQLTDEVRKNLDTYTEQAQRLTFWPFQAPALQRVLRAYRTPQAAPPRFDDTATIKSALSALGHGRTDLAGIYVVTQNGTLFSWTASGDLVARPATLTAPWYRVAMAVSPRTAFLPTRDQEMISVTTGRVVALARALTGPRNGETLGAVRVDLDAAAMAAVVQRISLGANGQLLVITPAGQVVYPVDPSADARRLAGQIVTRRSSAPVGQLRLSVGGRDLLATYDTSAPSGWMVVGVTPRDQLLAGTQHLGAFIVAVALLCILAGGLCATFVVARLTQPLRALRNAMGRVEARDLDTRIAVRSEDEVGQLAQGFNTMLAELRRLVDDVLRAQIHEREAELRALQHQINPHFLYNTLESINMLALTHGDRDISRMVTSLGRLLRQTIASGSVLIPLRDELEYIGHYLVVQRMRYGDRMTMTVEVESALLDYYVPKLTLQPLVENALYHGLEPRRGVGAVRVTGRREGADVILLVADDGVGMDAPTLAAVQASLRDVPWRGHRSVGLANVQQRLRLYCGPLYGLALRSGLGVGTWVEVRLPCSLRPQDLSEEAQGARRDGSEERDDDTAALAYRR